MTLFNYVSLLLRFFLTQGMGNGGPVRGADAPQPAARRDTLPGRAPQDASASTTPASSAPTVAPTQAAPQVAASGASSAAPQSQAVEQAKAAQSTDRTQLGLILKAILTGNTHATGSDAATPGGAAAAPLVETPQITLDESVARALAEGQLQHNRDAVIVQRVADVATAYSDGAPPHAGSGARDDAASALPALLARFEAATGPSGYVRLLQAMAAAPAPAGARLSQRL